MPDFKVGELVDFYSPGIAEKKRGHIVVAACISDPEMAVYDIVEIGTGNVYGSIYHNNMNHVIPVNTLTNLLIRKE